MLPRNIPVNQISWLCTHNAYNSADEIGAGANKPGGTNQNHSIPAQLGLGVRAMMIDIHGDSGKPRVRHESPVVANQLLPFEELCDLLVELKSWLTGNAAEVLVLLLEVTADVEPEWIRDTFHGAGPVGSKNGGDYDLKQLLFVPDPNVWHGIDKGVWPTIGQLAASGQRVLVFRETDDGKGRTKDKNGNEVSGLEFYMDMWKYWVETDYRNTPGLGDQIDKFYWENLQKNTYFLNPDRGNPATASFFNLNSFVDTHTFAVGSAGMAKGMNQDAYLDARALIAWKVHARRPTLSVDFFHSLASDQPPYDAVTTADNVSALPTLSGKMVDANSNPSTMDVTWEGLTELRFSDYLGKKYLDWDIDESVVPAITSTSRGGIYSFPPKKNGTPMTLTPVCRGHVFTPASVSWDGKSSATQDFTVTATSYATQTDLAQAQVLDVPLWIYPALVEDPVCYWEVAGDSLDEGARMQLWDRTAEKNEWRIRFADVFHGNHRFEIYNASLDRFTSVMYPWDKHPSIPGYPVTSQKKSQYVNTQRFYVHLFADGKLVFVSSDVGNYALVPENGNLGRSTKLVLGAFDHTFPDQYCWKAKSVTP